jgi:hypothetical protein
MCQLPAGAPAAASFQMGFENNYLWLYNTSSLQWEGYAAVTSSCSTSSAITETSCVSYTSPSGNYTWTTSNTYFDTIPNGGGCDSLMTIDLTIIPPLTGAVNDTICNNESVVVNGNTYDAATPSGTEVFTNVGAYSCDSTVSINLVVLPALESTINQTICAGESIVVNGTTYNTTVTGATEVFTGIGVYGCDSIVTINLIVEPLIDLSIVNVSPSLTSNQTGATYQWLDCDNANSVIVGETGQTFNATTNGNYAVEITLNSCLDTSACENIDGIGLNEFFTSNVLVYPNPTNHSVTIDLGSISTSVNYQVSTVDGRLLMHGTSTENLFVVDLSDQSNGVYFVNLGNGIDQRIYKLVKE